MSQSTFGGNGIGALKLIGPEGTPQRNQIERFSGVDGGFGTFHGRTERVLTFNGLITASNAVGAYSTLLAAIATIQEYIGTVATLTHYVGDTSQSYTYTRMDNYRRTGNFGFNSNIITVPIMAKFTQLYW